ncbi:hypothetical protein JOB18_030144 [Solea senegalensis]|uniref:Uncharacterized protein n=1 Tax=Solea senegalensis TaxID=28829 RepID=A0AAV6PW16_SOLSE|nr:hypothetical protein JOB18_030144 [Solea senegalensis]
MNSSRPAHCARGSAQNQMDSLSLLRQKQATLELGSRGDKKGSAIGLNPPPTYHLISQDQENPGKKTHKGNKKKVSIKYASLKNVVEKNINSQGLSNVFALFILPV